MDPDLDYYTQGVYELVARMIVCAWRDIASGGTASFDGPMPTFDCEQNAADAAVFLLDWLDWDEDKFREAAAGNEISQERATWAIGLIKQYA